MSPELERLLEAYDEKLTCPPEEKAQRIAALDRLLDQSLIQRPGTSRMSLLLAIQSRYAEFRRARRKPPTLPPTA
jgi:hypothetical protein